MGLSGTDKALMFAQFGVMRFGATRFGYTSPKAFVAINGVQYGTARAVDANKVLDGSLSITEVLNETPNTASFTMEGFEPSEGADVVITLGSIHNLNRLYAGTVLNRTHAYVGTPANWNAPINVIDYTWQLTRRRFSGQFTSVSPAVVAAAIVAVVPGFTLSVAAGLPTIDAISFTDVDALSALTQLAKRFGGYCDVDYHKVVKLFITDDSVTNPTDLTAAHVSLTEFSFTRDLSQVRTRIFVEGGGVTALALCAVGETIIPVETVAWYNPAGGTVKSGSQHLAYTGVSTGGGGALVGPGAAPGAALTATPADGTGVDSGVHQWAYGFTTVAGTSLAGPVAIATMGTVAHSVPALSLTISVQTGGALANAWYSYAVTFVTAAGETVAAHSQAWFVSYPLTALHLVNIPTGHHGGVIARKLYRTTAQVSPPAALAGPWFLCQTISDNTTTTVDDLVGDGSLGAQPPTTSTAGGYSVNTAVLTGIAIGPSGTTARAIYRTAAGGSQLKLLTTIADNTTTTITDSTADASLGANVPTGDTSGLSQSTGIVQLGSLALQLAVASAFSPTGGWAVVGNQVIRYTGISGNTLTGIPASGSGSIQASIDYNTTTTAAPALTGIPASGASSIVYPILQGDQVNLLVQVDDLAAQAALAALIGGTDDGIVEEYIQDGTIGETEARARGTAELALTSRVLVSLAFTTRDPNTHAGRTIAVSFGAPTNVSGTFQIQQVTIKQFAPALFPTYVVQASSNRFSLDDLLRLARKG